MKESKYPISGSNVIFRETGNSLLDIQRNGGDPSNVTVDNGIMGFNSTNSKVVYGQVVSGVKSVRILVNLNSTTEDILKLSASHSIECSGGTLTATGFSSPTIYIDGTATTTITTGWHEIIVTTATAINANVLQLGLVSGYLDGDVDFFELLNKALTASEVSNLYNKTQYKGLITDGLVGYWNFTKQTAYDFSKNSNNGTLTAGSGGFKKQGVYFDGTDINIGNIQLSDSFTVISVVNDINSANFLGKLGTLQFTWSAGKPVYYVRSSNGTWYSATTATTSIKNKYNILAYRKNALVTTGYLNGVAGTNGSFVSTIDNTTNDMYFGRYASSYFNGLVGASVLYNRALTDNEMAQVTQFFATQFNL